MKLANRELSWLSFNARVLQEALDEKNPLIERMHFLGIYSNNMDEFFRVRFAYVRRMVAMGKNSVQGFEGTTAELLDTIITTARKQQRKVQVAYKKILRELEEENIFHVDTTNVSNAQREELRDYFNLKLKHAIVPIMLDRHTPFPRLKDTGIYLAIKMEWDNKSKKRFALLEIPTEFPRFYRMHDEDKNYVILLDDIIRLNLDRIFSIFVYDKVLAFTFKFTRDAELDLDDDISGSILDKIKHSVKKRKIGEPVRFVYDEQMPLDLLEYLLRALNLDYGINTIAGGKYHNFKDFMSFPSFERPDFVFPQRPINKHPKLENQHSIIKRVMKEDVLIHFPYQRFDYVVDLLREAAIDPRVKSIKINVYRVANASQVMNALMNAVSNGKQVFVVLELQARFDEENNVYWANKLQEAGAKISFGMEGMKVHSKLIQIHRIGSKGEQFISYIGTGNFNEKTAHIYEDLGLMTANNVIGIEVERVFNILHGFTNNLNFKELIVSPFNVRKRFADLIQNEINFAKKGKKAKIKIKMNNLVDQEMIGLLYHASQQGVKIEMVIRGICCLVPGVEGLSKNIHVRSIVGRYLEHSRFMIFENGGNRRHFISSADWMERNLDKRIEVGVELHQKDIKERLEMIFKFLWKGNVKSRIIDAEQRNRYVGNRENSFNAQEELYNYYKEFEVSYVQDLVRE